MSHLKKLGILISLIGLFVYCGILTQPCLDSAGPQGQADLILMYTASLKGNLDGCSCIKIRRAGLVKRAYYLRRLTRPSQMVLVDAGDLLEAKKGDKLRSEYILNTYRELKYDAIALGDNELANGVLEYRENYPFLAGNLKILISSGAAVLSNEPLILTKGRYRIGIFAVMEPQFKSAAPVTELMSERFQITPVAETALKTVQLLKSQKTDLIILLYHGFYDNAVKLAGDVPGIDVMVLGHEEKLIDPQTIGRTVLVSPGEEGNRIGTLELSLAGHQITVLKNQFRTFNYGTDPDDPAVRKLIEKYYDSMIAPLDNNPTPIKSGSPK
jgi:2',3'-cyclic-nucleotide 2'-phosphodiesterase (5'-nucleotidase family)